MNKISLIKLSCLLLVVILACYAFVRAISIYINFFSYEFISLVSFPILFILYFYIGGKLKHPNTEKYLSSIGTALLVFSTGFFDHVHYSEGLSLIEPFLSAMIYYFALMLLAFTCLFENKLLELALIIRLAIIGWITLTMIWLIILYYIFGTLM